MEEEDGMEMEKERVKKERRERDSTLRNGRERRTLNRGIRPGDYWP